MSDLRRFCVVMLTVEELEILMPRVLWKRDMLQALSQGKVSVKGFQNSDSDNHPQVDDMPDSSSGRVSNS